MCGKREIKNKARKRERNQGGEGWNEKKGRQSGGMEG